MSTSAHSGLQAATSLERGMEIFARLALPLWTRMPPLRSLSIDGNSLLLAGLWRDDSTLPNIFWRKLQAHQGCVVIAAPATIWGCG